MHDDEFIAYLRAYELQREYRTRVDQIIKDIGQEFDEKRSELQNEKLRYLELDKWHRNILNSCIFPFTETEVASRVGYHFVRASPLHELEVPNFDFLIYNPEKKSALIGEAKGQLDDEGEVVKQTKERILIANANSDHIKKSYLNSNSADFDFVMGVQWYDANRLAKCVARRGGGIVVWQAGGDFKTESVKLGIFVPGNEEKDVAKSMMHHDDRLNHELSDVKTSYEFKTFFVESHPVAKMTILNFVDARKPDGVFTFDDLLELVRNEIGYMDEATVKRQTNEIIELGLKIGLIKEEGAALYKITETWA